MGSVCHRCAAPRRRRRRRRRQISQLRSLLRCRVPVKRATICS